MFSKGIFLCLYLNILFTRMEDMKMGNGLDITEIIKKISGNKELMAQIAKVDPKQGVELLKKANINVDEDDIKKIQATVADGKLDLGDIKNLAGGIFGK